MTSRRSRSTPWPGLAGLSRPVVAALACLLAASPAAARDLQGAGELLAFREEASVPAPGEVRPLLIENVRIVDPEVRRVRRGALLLEDGRIDAVLSSAPREFEGRRLDAGGAWVIPGLWDMHVHSTSNKSPTFEDLPPLKTERAARAMLHAGVTGFLDLFGPEDYLFRLRERQREGEFIGARIHAAGPILTAPGGHGTQFAVETRTVSSPEEARSTVDALAERRPDVVKLVFHPGVARNNPRLESMDAGTMRALVDAAERHGLKTVAHIDRWDGAHATVQAGVDAITHTPLQPVPDSLIAAMREEGTAWIPTLSVLTELPRLASDTAALSDPLLRAVTGPRLQTAYRELPEDLRRRAASMSELREDVLARTRTLHEAGVPILAGTDAGNVGVFQGYSLHRELELYVEAGLTEWEALAAATIRAGRFLGVETGVRPGDRADLVILDASPLDDITNTRRIRTVIFDGRIVDRRRLLEEAGVAGDAPAAGS